MLPTELGESMAFSKLVVEPLHDSIVSGRRIRKIVAALAEMLPKQPQLRILDVGCGSGELLLQLQRLHPHIECSGVDVLVRPDTYIPVMQFDGLKLPYEDNAFDCVLLIDVLHHVDEQKNFACRMHACCQSMRPHKGPYLRKLVGQSDPQGHGLGRQ